MDLVTESLKHRYKTNMGWSWNQWLTDPWWTRVGHRVTDFKMNTRHCNPMTDPHVLSLPPIASSYTLWTVDSPAGLQLTCDSLPSYPGGAWLSLKYDRESRRVDWEKNPLKTTRKFVECFEPTRNRLIYVFFLSFILSFSVPSFFSVIFFFVRFHIP